MSKSNKSSNAPKNVKHSYTVTDLDTGEIVYQGTNLGEIREMAGFYHDMIGQNVDVKDDATGKDVKLSEGVPSDALDALAS